MNVAAIVAYPIQRLGAPSAPAASGSVVEAPRTDPARRDAVSLSEDGAAFTKTPDQLSEGERRQVEALKARDREVRAHEEAHQRVGGQYAGAPKYEYEKGPDGQRDAVGGEVAIDASPVRDDPEATIEKMQIVKRAALAPAEPSAQDRKVAAQADAEMRKAQAELNAQARDALSGATSGDDPPLLQRALDAYAVQPALEPSRLAISA